MLYLATASGPLTREAMRRGELGHLDTPESGNRLIPGVPWALDNGCFSARWTVQRWTKALLGRRSYPNCLFAVVPDVLGNASATDGLWYRYADLVRELGYRPAYVTQNGCQSVPSDAEVLFTGGDNDWKEGTRARDLMEEARARGLWCHMGRVNTRTRLTLAEEHGYDSVDGTMLAYGPRKNLPILLRWLRELPPRVACNVR